MAFGKNAAARAQNQSSQAAAEIAAIARQQYEQAAPIRAGVFDRTQQFVEGGFRPEDTFLFAPTQRAVGEQFDVARRNLLDTLPVGGALNEGLTNVEIGRARTLSDEIARLASQELGNAFNIATGSQSQVLQGLGAAQQGALGAAQVAQQGSQNQIGNLLALGQLGLG